MIREKVLKKEISIRESTLKNIGTYILFALLFMVLTRAKVFSIEISVFAYGVYFALLWCKFNHTYLSISYLVGAFAGDFGLHNIYSSCFVALIGLGFGLYSFRKNICPKWLVLLVSSLSQTLSLYLQFSGVNSIPYMICGVLVGAFLCYATMVVCSATVLRNYILKLCTDEKIFSCILIVMFACGLQSFSIGYLEPIKTILTLLLLFLSVFHIPSIMLTLSVAFGFGSALYTGDITAVAIYVSICTFAIIFMENKYLCGLAIFLSNLVLELCFLSSNYISSSIAVAVGVIIYLLIPNRFITKSKNYFMGNVCVAEKSIVARSKEQIAKRMHEISNIFLEMDRTYRAMVHGVMPTSMIVDEIGNEVVKACCKNCENKNKCIRLNGKYTTEVFNELISKGIERGKVSLLDVSQYLSSRCNKLNSLLSTVNDLLSGYKNYATTINNLDASRLLIAEQLSGVSGIVDSLSQELKSNIVYDTALEKKIMEELNYISVNCLECIVYEKDIHTKNITITIKNLNIDNDKKMELEKTISKACGIKVVLCDINQIVSNNCYVITFKTKPKLDMVYGCASASKTGSESSGDTHTLIKIDDGKYMIALCDGMGSGDGAKNTSNLSISLLENFYKAGFNNDLILSSVNKLLCMCNDENFTALDIAIFDFREGMLDMIKLGSPYSFIKHSNDTDVIDRVGLPMGVLDEMKPHIVSFFVKPSDILVLVTDGITDAFGGAEDLQIFINSLDKLNPQEIAEDILSRAKELEKNCLKDDMSVAVARVY